MSVADTHVRRFSELNCDPLMGGVSIISFAELHTHVAHPAMEIIETECHGLPAIDRGFGSPRRPCADRARFKVARFFETLTACDACRAKADMETNMSRAKLNWEGICPEAFRNTSKDHPDFPKAQYEATKSWPQVSRISNDDVNPKFKISDESLMFFGPSGKGKSRLAMMLLKRCLVRWDLHVAVMWSEQLKAVRTERDILVWIAKWGKPDVLLLDDAILASASDSRTADALKDLLDNRIRNNRVNIVTSQIGGDDVREQLAKFGKDTKADRELVEAMLRRLRQSYRVISFADVDPRQTSF